MYYLDLRNELIEKGYDARLVNGSCYDINQDGVIHYLAYLEALALNRFKADHPVNLDDYVSSRTSLNKWYSFKM